MRHRIKTVISMWGAAFGFAAFVLAAGVMAAPEVSAHAPRLMAAAADGARWPEKPEEYTAWVLMLCSAVTSVANLLEAMVRKWWSLQQDRPKGKRRRKAEPPHEEMPK